MPQRLVLLDASFVVALENLDDPRHEQAVHFARKLSLEGCAFVLHWGILLEIGDGYARLGRREKGVQLLSMFQREQGYLIRPLTEPLLQEAVDLFRNRQDKEWGLTDCISFVLMRQEGIGEALTADTHFQQAGFTAMLLGQP